MHRSEINFVAVPKYSEISVEKLWRFVQECEDILQYFPYMDEGKLPERDFMMGILCTFKNAEMKELIKQARDSRALSNNSDTDMMVEVVETAKDQLLSLLPNKSKCYKA